jgi:ADP-ribosylglycohydrolase
VLDTLQAAIWAVENGTDFKSIVLNAVNLGDDADTTAAVAGQIAGAMHGYAVVESDLKTDLLKERELYVTSQFLGNQTNEK